MILRNHTNPRLTIAVIEYFRFMERELTVLEDGTDLPLLSGYMLFERMEFIIDHYLCTTLNRGCYSRVIIRLKTFKLY